MIKLKGHSCRNKVTTGSQATKTHNTFQSKENVSMLWITAEAWLALEPARLTYICHRDSHHIQLQPPWYCLCFLAFRCIQEKSFSSVDWNLSSPPAKWKQFYLKRLWQNSSSYPPSSQIEQNNFQNTWLAKAEDLLSAKKRILREKHQVL